MKQNFLFLEENKFLLFLYPLVKLKFYINYSLVPVQRTNMHDISSQSVAICLQPTGSGRLSLPCVWGSQVY